jgi:hypothetical protein
MNRVNFYVTQEKTQFFAMLLFKNLIKNIGTILNLIFNIVLVIVSLKLSDYI